MALLKKHGGSGKINPRTGIMEFDSYDSGNYGETGGYDTTGYNEPVSSADAGTQQNVPTVETTTKDSPFIESTPFGEKVNYTEQIPAYDPLSKESLANIKYQSVKPSVAAPAPVEQTGQSSQASQSLARYPGDEMSAAAAAVPSATGDEEKKPLPWPQRIADYIKPVTSGAETLTKALEPLTPYAKFGTQALGIYQANKAANQTREESARNEAEIRALADPYRKQAELMQQQGQNMLAAGQSGQLTPQQQQDLETRRAVALQQQAAAGVSGGTAQQQVEADIQRTAQQYAQQNINQGLALMSQAQSVTGAADSLIKQAIAAGYSGSQDANKLASDFYNAIGFSLPQTSSKGPTNG
jgi:hypothetical protein